MTFTKQADGTWTTPESSSIRIIRDARVSLGVRTHYVVQVTLPNGRLDEYPKKSLLRATGEAEEILKRALRFHDAAVIVAAGRCPVCGQGIHRNIALTGWWQCDGYGAEGFRKAGAIHGCDWQTFTRN